MKIVSESNLYWSVPWLNVISILPSRVVWRCLLPFWPWKVPLYQFSVAFFSCLFVSENFKSLLSHFSSGFKLLHLWKMRCKNISKYKHTQVSFIVKQTHKPTTKTLPVVVHSPSPLNNTPLLWSPTKLITLSRPFKPVVTNWKRKTEKDYIVSGSMSYPTSFVKCIKTICQQNKVTCCLIVNPLYKKAGWCEKLYKQVAAW